MFEAKYPTAHPVHELTPELEKVPQGQFEQGVPPDVAKPNVPAEHAVHEVEPVDDAYVPREQAVHEPTRAPAGEEVPAGQAVHDPDPAAE